MFEKFRKFWDVFINSIKTAYSKSFKEPLPTSEQKWRDANKLNLLVIFVGTLNNLTNVEATFEVASDSILTDRLKELCKDIEQNRFDITSPMLADGDFYIFPATNSRGQLIHTYLTQQQVRILRMDGTEITEAYGIIDWEIGNDNRAIYLLRHHVLEPNGTLIISYSVVNESGNNLGYVDNPKWQDLLGYTTQFANANHIGFGRYKSPTSSRGLSPVYGVPLNFGCAEIEKTIFEDLQLIQDEFRNGKSVIFIDPRNLLRDDEKREYRIPQNVIPIKSRAGQSGSEIDIFNPTLRFSEHYSKLVNDMGLLEKQIGTSKGILTENETAYTATATAVRRSNSDTLALIDKIRNAIDAGNKMTLEADAVFLNISKDLWTYKSDWYDPFEDPSEQWQRLLEAKNNGAAEEKDLIQWIFPKMTEDEVNAKLQAMRDIQKANTNEAIERILNGQ